MILRVFYIVHDYDTNCAWYVSKTGWPDILATDGDLISSLETICDRGGFEETDLDALFYDKEKAVELMKFLISFGTKEHPFDNLELKKITIERIITPEYKVKVE